jgi:hypothetical protein
METSLSLGLAYEDVLDTATAAEFYERCAFTSISATPVRLHLCRHSISQSDGLHVTLDTCRHVELAQNAGYYHDAENGGAGRQHLIRVLVIRAKDCESKGLDGTALLQRCLQARITVEWI